MLVMPLRLEVALLLLVPGAGVEPARRILRGILSPIFCPAWNPRHTWALWNISLRMRRLVD